jgi:lysozyme
MKIKIFKIVFLISILIVIVLGILLYFRVIWFVYPNKNKYSVYGLDVSNHQGIIDWENVDEKYKFVFVKATEGDTFVDKQFNKNANSVKNTGRILGAYHFFHFNYNGIDQANNFINTAGNIIDLPPVVDFEFSGNPDSYKKDLLLNELKNCINKLEEHYKHSVIIYTTKDAYKYIIKGNFDNPIWYRSIILPLNKKIKNVKFWQYHNSAKIKGIDNKVDLNVFKGNLNELNDLIMMDINS